MEDLTGLHIIVTRPSAQAEPWAARLRELGATTRIAPLLDIVPVSETAQIQAIKNCILNLDVYCKAIFVSKNAVEQAFNWIDNYWPQLPIELDFFAVGETTAKQLQACGVKVTDLAQSQTGAMTSETLLQSPALQDVADEKVVIFRGVGGRPHIGEVLSARGAKVDYCELYERMLPSDAIPHFAAVLSLLANESPSTESPSADHVVLVLHSGEALENLQKVLRELAVNIGEISAQMFLLVPSQRIAELAEAAGFIYVFAAQNATEASMLQGLIDLATRHK
jgi:uroporphyrinogen-III synthase